jgi:serine/threonine-protein kinase
VWNDDIVKDAKPGADFAVTGEAKFKKLSAKLAASGITVEKFVLTSWTVKATDKKTAEEIYYNTKIPEKTSWATEDEAIREIGNLIGEEFSKDFFLAHFQFSGQKMRLRLQGLPGKETAQQILHELHGLRSVVAASLVTGGANEAVFDTEISGGLASATDLVQAAILKPLNHKLGAQCFNITATSASEISALLKPGCKEPAIISRLDTMPPAALIEAPLARRQAVVKNPETLRKISM